MLTLPEQYSTLIAAFAPVFTNDSVAECVGEIASPVGGAIGPLLPACLGLFGLGQ